MSQTETVTPGLGRLRGKGALITGAANGIGRATALVFAAEGARLVINDVRRDRLESLAATIRAAGGEVELAVGDVSDEADARRMVDLCVDTFGGIDILFANAGIIPIKSLREATAEDFDHVMAVDGRGMFLTCKFAAAAMETKGGGGAIICTSSISGMAGQADQAVYGPAKFVATGLVRHLGVELAARGIRVNGVAPGTIRTEALAALSEDYVRTVSAAHPAGRIGEPREVANAVLFLASDEASFITGTILAVDGGYLAQ